MIMKRSLKTLCGFFAVLALLVSCNATTPLAYDGPVPNKELHNYFYANNAGKTPPTKITTEDTFERYFGESAYMGKSGEPTRVDFDAQFVIALIRPIYLVKVDSQYEAEEVVTVREK